MRAILIATEAPGTDPGRRMSAMRMLLDRPLIQHVVEMIVAQGTRRIDVMLSDDASAIESALGDGSRWGAALCYHLVADGSSPYAALHAATAPDRDEAILLGRADHLVEFGPDAEHGLSAVACMNPANPDEWTGWASVRGRHLQDIALSCDHAGLAAKLLLSGRPVVARDVVAIRDDRSALDAQCALLSGRFPHALRSGKEVEQGIWISRNVRLHPSARLIAPVHIGEDCRIGPGVTIGPDVAMGAGSVIDAGTTLREVVIAARTYVGRGLELKRMIVDQNRIVSVDSGAILETGDMTITSGVSSDSTRAAIRDLIDRCVALVAIPIALPVAACGWILAGARGLPLSPRWTAVVRLPATSDSRRWKTFRLWRTCEPGQPVVPSLTDFATRIWPGLFAVAAGRMRIVGLEPRSADQLRGLAPATREFTVSGRAGLITEAMVRLETDATDIERTVAEACHASTGGFLHDCKLIAGYVVLALRSAVKPALRQSPTRLRHVETDA